MKSVAVISRGVSDFTIAMEASGIDFRIIDPADIEGCDLDRYRSILILGGTSDRSLLFTAPARKLVDRQIADGKRVFCEYVSSIADIYFTGPEPARRRRLLYNSGGLAGGPLENGILLDAQSNDFLPPFMVNGNGEPILLYAKTGPAHRRVEVPELEKGKPSNWALWYDRPNLLVSTIRLCNFSRARFSPTGDWRRLVSHILSWACGEEVSAESLPRQYGLRQGGAGTTPDADALHGVTRAVKWFEDARMLIGNGRRGVKEGMSAVILADGTQTILDGVRTDCCGETALLYYLSSRLRGSGAELEVSDNLLDFCFDNLQVTDPGPYRGMVRWSESGWSVCYQDDVARVLIPALLRTLYGGKPYRLDECSAALDFLVSTTGTDGTRVHRTDLNRLGPAEIDRLRSEPGNCPSAHYNGFYLGALALCSKLTGNETFLRTAETGLGTIMEVYPDTRREHSETQELCRLIAPLSWLYWATGSGEHREWLYRAAGDLERFRHPSKGYAEWDTGYTASCSRNENGECSLLSNNGDPVADLLYSVNWLPLGFMQAYFVTRDGVFLERWRSVSRFLLDVQVESANPLINGGWPRAVDMDLMEVFAAPYDVGWGPWSIESGWTVAEIASGLALGVMREELAGCY